MVRARPGGVATQLRLPPRDQVASRQIPATPGRARAGPQRWRPEGFGQGRLERGRVKVGGVGGGGSRRVLADGFGIPGDLKEFPRALASSLSYL